MEANRYTLVIPTYNRPADLGRQLRFLAHQKAAFRVLVLDSSSDANHATNRASAAGLALDLEIQRFDPVMPPFEKFWRGAEMVRTEYASMCADDDLVLVDSISQIVGFLERNPGHSIAHGWYFQFYLESALGLTSILYRSPSIEADAWTDRLYSLLSGYEAITYGVYRTEVLRRVLFHTQDMRSMLARELLGGTLALIAGKAARLPVVYSGRSLGPSGSYAHWHPIEFLASTPRGMFEEYARYKAKLFEFCAERGVPVGDAEQSEKLVDLAHMRYVSQYFTPEIIDHIYAETVRGRTGAELLGGVWPILSKRAGIEGAFQRSGTLRRLRNAFVPGLRDYHVRRIVAPNSYAKIPARTASGKERTVEVYEVFRAAMVSGNVAPGESALIEQLAGYE